jgi:mono/diheme cytochrome c family protein
VAALGAATLGVRLGVDREDLPIAASKHRAYGTEIDMRDALHAELAAELLHLYEGQQLERLPAAIKLFAEWLMQRRLFSEYLGDEHQAMRRAFAERALHEWLSPHCIACRGSKKQQRSRSGQWLAPAGNMQRNAIFRPCSACHGSGAQASSPPQRMKALGLTREQYEAGRWDQKFSAARIWLGDVLRKRITRVLTAELERRKRHV